MVYGVNKKEYNMKLLCRIFGHRMFFDTDNVCGTSTCKRKLCDHKEENSINWKLNKNMKPNDNNKEGIK